MHTILLCIIGIVLTGIYLISRRKFKYWKNQNVPYLEPTPILGNYGDIILYRRHISHAMNDLCKKFPSEPYFGAFFGTEPTLVVKDPDLLKLITTKDFYYFSGRETSNYVHKEEFTQNLFFNSGDEWKVVRQNLTPVFTTSKMKNMFHLIANCSYELENLLDSEAKISNVIQIRTIIGRFTMACIMSCAFGVDSETMGVEFKKSPFTKVADSFFVASKLNAFKIMFKSVWPAIFYTLGLRVTPPGTNEFFKDFLLSVFQARNYKPTNRNDFIDFILNFKETNHLTGDSIQNLKSGKNDKVQLPVTDELLLAQSLVFFLAGFETSATTTGYTVFELAKKPEALKKVLAEVDAYLDKYEDKLTYEIVNELPYTWACVEEALRLYPVLVNLTREVVEDYTLPSGVVLEKGVRVHIPVYNMHRDPKYFPEPEVYRPERFYGDERRKVIPYSYMPFGEGSRICIGMRFAKMQVLAGLVTLLKKYSVSLPDNASETVEFDPLLFIPTPKSPLTVKITPREGHETRMFVKA